ncbi:Amino acid transporter [Arachidicoccus rhizosphaerae]|uniref:Amino acid transporter n=1 Tax=Arachidicoccus rhizosphaerae TaxID=551991 RepID=A0A1H4CUV8_9BACT|nr:APC family permease [Arachidicoccus rhizosphaerae]SEA64223.1 Amino acid transporter [Arachidicoccus rhizosphaerae]
MSHSKKLSEFSATAICGNDITSSCLYVSALTIAYAGQYAWLALLIVAGVLFLFRKIYGEVVGALPLNGGAYNVLLNTTSKSNASIAACLTILSYMTTAVISASEAMHYLKGIFPSISVMIATIILITLFLLLVMSDISESSVVAAVIFTLHLAAMLLLIGSGIWFVLKHGLSTASLNFRAPLQGGFWTALFLGFSTAMLGISGFESSANFVEEQKPGIFRKTLRNMWIAVTVINPLMALTAVMVLPIGEVVENKEALLSFLGENTGGSWLATFISIDAVLVLSGALLTSYVGVNGLIKRMTLDRILPQFLLKENSRGSSPRILLLFYILCLSVLFITHGQLGPLAGVYTISFLLVMIYFGLGNFLLKIKRGRLPRPENATVASVAVAIIAVAGALYGNVVTHAAYLIVFLQYFLPAIIIIFLLLSRNEILKYMLILVNHLSKHFKLFAAISRLHISRNLKKLTEQEFVYFTKGDDISILNKVMMYVEENEITKRLKIVTVLKDEGSVSDDFMTDLEVLDRAYPDIKIEYVQIRNATFGPETIKRLSDEWNIPINFMFISSPSDRFAHRVSDLGGVRLII